MAQNVQNPTLRIIVIGTKDGGKTRTTNSIFEDPTHFPFSGGIQLNYNAGTIQVEDRLIYIVDTPGTFENNLLRGQIRDELTHLNGMGPVVFLLCIPMGRIAGNDIARLRQFLEVFEDNMRAHTMVIFTKEDQWIANLPVGRELAIHRDLFFAGLPEAVTTFLGNGYHMLWDNNNPGDRLQILNNLRDLRNRNGGFVL